MNINDPKLWQATTAVSAIAMPLVTFGLTEWWRKKKPQHIICKVIQRGSMLKLSKEARSKLDIKYNSTPIFNLSYVTVKVWNAGDQPITSPTITLTFSEGTKILDSNCDTPSKYVGEDYPIRLESDGETAKVTLPFLNPYKDHKHALNLTFHCDGDLSLVRFTGGGVGWSIKEHVPTKPSFITDLNTTALSLTQLQGPPRQANSFTN